MRMAFFVVILSLANIAQVNGQMTVQENGVSLENFEQYPPQAFPDNWKVRGDEDTAHVVYRVAEEDGNHFLHAYAENQDVQIGLTKAFPPKQLPILQWRWRAKQLPLGANEQTVKTNDSAAGVYVVFDSTLIPRAIKYVWSSSLPVGARLTSPVYWRAKVVVLESGATSDGGWRQETVNFYEDYKRLFDAEPGEVKGVAILTDSDATATVAEADYDDFALFEANAVPGGPTNGATALLRTPGMLKE